MSPATEFCGKKNNHVMHVFGDSSEFGCLGYPPPGTPDSPWDQHVKGHEQYSGSLENDPVNHPDHYGGKDDIYEAIKVIEAWKLGWHLGDTVKYIARAGKKNPDKEIEDLEKAAFYLKRHIKNLKKARG